MSEKKTILCFGEVLWDSLPRGIFPGGAPVNVAYHLTQFGHHAVPVTAVGRDFRIFVGLEDLSFPMMTVGACGLMNAVGNLRPKVLAEMCEAVWRGDLSSPRWAACGWSRRMWRKHASSAFLRRA